MKTLLRRGLDSLAYRIAARLAAQDSPLWQAFSHVSPSVVSPSVSEQPTREWFREAARIQAQDLAKILANQAPGNYQNKFILDRVILLAGQIAARQLHGRERLRHLGEAEFRVTSQWGEDGIIEWLCAKLPELPRSFVEFGVQNYAEANTRFLLQNRGWKGLILDADDSYMRQVRADEIYWKFDLSAVTAMITAENIDALIMSHGFAGDLGILSVDIDGNDYWVLKAISCVNPGIIIMEINGVFGDLKAITVPYRPDFTRLDAHYSGQYFGCSIEAARQLCKERGYTYLGTNTNGVNAFFVRNDLAPAVVGSLDEIRTWPARHRDSRTPGGTLDFVRGLQKYDLIKGLPVYDLASSQLVEINELGKLYSAEFLGDFA
jgi:hypothetical protein